MTNHKYENWELFGKFVCHAVDNYIDQIDEFIRVWSYGGWSEIENEWPEFVDFAAKFYLEAKE